MKTRFAAAAIACCLLATLVLAQDEVASAGPDVQQTIRHVVLFEFKEDAPADKIREIEAAFAALEGKIDQVADLEWGTNNSPEGLNQGFTHCFLVTFESKDDRDAYLPHPAHQEFVTLLRPYLKEALVVDFAPDAH